MMKNKTIDISTFIGKDSKINGGVYLGGGPREAVVVNDDETQPELGRLYERLLQNIKNEGGDYKTKALREVFELVSETLEYDKDEVEAIYESRGSVPDKKLGLNIYVANGVGVCRHQALLCGYLLERLVEENQDRIVNTCFGFVQNRQDAEDVAQTVFIQAYKSIHKFRGDSTISTWLYRIAVNYSLNYIKSKKDDR